MAMVAFLKLINYILARFIIIAMECSVAIQVHIMVSHVLTKQIKLVFFRTLRTTSCKGLGCKD